MAMVSSFRYLGQTLTEVDNDWPDFFTNLLKAQTVLDHLSRILGVEGTYERTLGRFYILVLQATLLFGSNTGVVTPHMQRNLEGFHHRVERHLTGKITCHQADGVYICHTLEEAMQESVFEKMEVYIERLQNMVTQYISTWTIMDLCLED